MPVLCSYELPDGFSVEYDNVNKLGWHELIDRFSDANIYQTWSYDAIRHGANNVSHFVLFKDGQAVAAGQARIVSVPLLKLGVAYFRWGPMWRLHDRPEDARILKAALLAIHTEYAVKRGLSVRLLPYLFSGQPEPALTELTAGGFTLLEAASAQRTLMMSLDESLSELRAGLDQKWRNCLNRAEKNNLVIEEGTDDMLFDRFVQIHREMHRRKGFASMSDIDEFRSIQRDLPERHKMRIFLATEEGKLAAGVVSSKIGCFGIFLHGATSDAGMSSCASYLLQWRVLDWLKTSGANQYNLHGINPDTNPGTYRFKAGLAGRRARDVHYAGTYESNVPNASRVLVGVAGSIKGVYSSSRTAVRAKVRELRESSGAMK